MEKLGNVPKNPIIGLWRLLKGFRLFFIGAIGIQMFAVLSGTAGYMLLKYFVDDVIVSNKSNLPLFAFAGMYVMFSVFRGIFFFMSGRLTARTSEGIIKEVRNALFDHLQKLSFTYHDKNETGELIQRSTSDVDTIRRFYSEIVIEFSRIFFMFFINFIFILILNVRLGLLSVIAIPVLILVSTYFFTRIFKSYDMYQEQDGKVSARLQENLTGIRIVRAFARQDFEIERFDRENSRKLKLGKRFMWDHALYWPISHFICSIQTIAGTLIAANMVLNDIISIGTLVAYIGMVNMIIWPMQQMGRLIAQLSTTSVSYNRVTDIIKEEIELLSEGDHGDSDREIRGDLVFDKVCFEYEKELPVLRDINFSCKKGEVIALVGSTGSGKTSLVNLLPRFYDYTDGEIYLDGVLLEKYSRHFLRKEVGIVEQEPFLFSMSIKENIMYGVEREVTFEDVEAVAMAASIHESIISFPKGYDTVVGERGVSLSGGQRQRIAIARTLLKDPSILILDDSTSAIDPETESSIRGALNVLMEGKTTFVIAHRVQSLMNADKILVFRHGRIIQSGPHEELIQSEGFYKEIFDLQTKIDEELDKECEYAGVC